MGLYRPLRPPGRGHRGDAGGLGLEAHRTSPDAPDRAVSGPRARQLSARQPPCPLVGGCALLRAGDRVHPVPAAVLPIRRRGTAGEVRARGSGSGARARPHRGAGPAPGRRAALSPGPIAVRGSRADAQCPARRDRRHARRRLEARRRAEAHRVLTRCDPVRRALQRRKLVTVRNVLAVLRSPRDLLGRLRRPRPATGAHGHVPTTQLPARLVRQHARILHGRARSDSPGAYSEPTPPHDVAQPRIQREGPGRDRGVARVARPSGSVAPLLRVPVL